MRVASELLAPTAIPAAGEAVWTWSNGLAVKFFFKAVTLQKIQNVPQCRELVERHPFGGLHVEVLGQFSKQLRFLMLSMPKSASRSASSSTTSGG